MPRSGECARPCHIQVGDRIDLDSGVATPANSYSRCHAVSARYDDVKDYDNGNGVVASIDQARCERMQAGAVHTCPYIRAENRRVLEELAREPDASFEDIEKLVRTLPERYQEVLPHARLTFARHHRSFWQEHYGSGKNL